MADEWRNISTAGSIYTVSDLNWKVAAVGDFDGDGKSDIFWLNTSNGQAAIWLMDGTNYSQAQNLSQNIYYTWNVVRASDFNGDGKADILFRNTVSGQNAIWLMDGFTLTSAETIYTVSDLTWQMH